MPKDVYLVRVDVRAICMNVHDDSATRCAADATQLKPLRVVDAVGRRGAAKMAAAAVPKQNTANRNLLRTGIPPLVNARRLP